MKVHLSTENMQETKITKVILQKLHWSQILKEGKVNIPNSAAYFNLLTSVYWTLWTTAMLSWRQGRESKFYSIVQTPGEQYWHLLHRRPLHTAAERLASGKSATAKLRQVWQCTVRIWLKGTVFWPCHRKHIPVHTVLWSHTCSPDILLQCHFQFEVPKGRRAALQLVRAVLP